MRLPRQILRKENIPPSGSRKKKTSVELKISKDKYYKVRAWYKKMEN